MPDTLDPARDVSAHFIATVHGWLASSGEVLVVLRYLRAAGRKGYALCHSSADFEAIVAEAPPGTDIEVFRERQLPIRGLVTDQFIAEALTAVGTGEEHMV